MARPILTARYRHVAIAAYAIPPLSTPSHQDAESGPEGSSVHGESSPELRALWSAIDAAVPPGGELELDTPPLSNSEIARQTDNETARLRNSETTRQADSETAGLDPAVSMSRCFDVSLSRSHDPSSSPGAIISLVAISAENAKVWGVGVPGQGSYNELALRLHVRRRDEAPGRGTHGGVLTIKRFVSRRLIAGAMRKLLHEPVFVQPIDESVTHQARRIDARFTLDFRPPMLVPGPGQIARPDGTPGTYTLSLAAAKPWSRVSPAGVDSWLKEPRWTYSSGMPAMGGAPGRPAGGGTGRMSGREAQPRGPRMFETQHPLWSIYPCHGPGQGQSQGQSQSHGPAQALGAAVDVDFGNLFGSAWGYLGSIAPFRSVLAVGTDVAMFPLRPLMPPGQAASLSELKPARGGTDLRGRDGTATGVVVVPARVAQRGMSGQARP